MIQVIQTEPELQCIKPYWNHLFEDSVKASPFQHFDFIYAAVKALGNISDIYIICVRNDSTNHLEAIFPFCLEYGVLRFINAAHSDFCAGVIASDCNIYKICESLAEHILNSLVIKKVELINLLPNDPLLAALKPFAKTCFVSDCNYYSTINICQQDKDKDFIDAFRNVNAKQRKNFRTLLKKNDGNVLFKIYDSKNDDEYPQEIVNYLTEKMICDGKRVRSYFSENMLRFWKELYDKGILIAAVLQINGEIKSLNFMYYDTKRKEYIKWIMLYIENHFNLLINLYIAKYIYEDGGATINFARGIYDYKLVNFHPEVKPLFRLIISKSMWSSLWALWRVDYYYIRQIGKKILRK